MYNSANPCFSEGKRYVEELDWWLVPIRGIGHGNDGKAPIYKGWPEVRPGIEQLHVMLEHNGDAGIGLHLGGSGLIDLEGDTAQGERICEQLCKGLDFPCYRSRKSKHRLFQAHDAVAYLKIEGLGIEFSRWASPIRPAALGGHWRRKNAIPMACQPIRLPIAAVAGSNPGLLCQARI